MTDLQMVDRLAHLINGDRADTLRFRKLFAPEHGARVTGKLVLDEACRSLPRMPADRAGRAEEDDLRGFDRGSDVGRAAIISDEEPGTGNDGDQFPDAELTECGKWSGRRRIDCRKLGALLGGWGSGHDHLETAGAQIGRNCGKSFRHPAFGVELIGWRNDGIWPVRIDTDGGEGSLRRLFEDGRDDQPGRGGLITGKAKPFEERPLILNRVKSCADAWTVEDLVDSWNPGIVGQ